MGNHSYIDALINDCNRAKNAVADKEFVLGEISELDGIIKGVYVIEEIGGDPISTFDDFVEYKNRKARKCPKANSASSVLYVGSSTTGIKKRISQHIGNGYAGTYALNLSHWFKGNYQISIRQYSESRQVIQLIEDALSFELRPAFGKQGGNGK